MVSEPGEVFWIVLNKEDGTENGVVLESPAGASDLTLSLDRRALEDLISGKMSPQQAFMKGLVKIRGKMSLAMSLEELLKVFKKSSKL